MPRSPIKRNPTPARRRSPLRLATLLPNGRWPIGRMGVRGNCATCVDAWPHLVLIDRAGKIAWTSRDLENEALMALAAQKAGLVWPPKDMNEPDLQRLHVAAFSMQIEKLLGPAQR